MTAAKFQPTADTVEVIIGDRTYRIQPLPLKTGRRLWFRLLKVITPMFGAMVAAGASAGDDVGMARVQAAKAMIDGIVENLSEELFEQMIKEFAAHSSYVDEKGTDFLLSATIDTTAFRGDYAALVMWLKECVRVNYGSFLAALPALLPEA